MDGRGADREWRRVEVAACEEMESPQRAGARGDPRRQAQRRGGRGAREGHRPRRRRLRRRARGVGRPGGALDPHGLTSSDVLDTALALTLRDAGEIVLAGARELVEALAARAREHVDTLTVGRTHGIHAEPTTFGVKLAGLAFEAHRNEQRLAVAFDGVAIGAISGAVGTYSATSPAFEERVLARLDLAREDVSTQVVARDRHAALLGAIALAGAGLERIATEVRHLQRTEVMEAAEPFRAGTQKGSSSMPHKRNPITSERIAGLARVLRGNATAALENVTLWHERDISHSSVERVILPDSTILLDYMQHLAIRVVRGLEVDAERMRANLELTHGALFSQRVLLALVEGGARPRQRLPRRPGARAAGLGRRARRCASWSPPTRAPAGLDLDEVFDTQRLHAPRRVRSSRGWTRSRRRLACVPPRWARLRSPDGQVGVATPALAVAGVLAALVVEGILALVVPAGRSVDAQIARRFRPPRGQLPRRPDGGLDHRPCHARRLRRASARSSSPSPWHARRPRLAFGCRPRWVRPAGRRSCSRRCSLIRATRIWLTPPGLVGPASWPSGHATAAMMVALGAVLVSPPLLAPARRPARGGPRDRRRLSRS